MREKIIQIIEEENRNLNPIEIMDKIKTNSTVDDLTKLMQELDS